LLQEQATENIQHAALELLLNPSLRQQTLADYQQMRLGNRYVSDRAAQEILQLLLNGVSSLLANPTTWKASQ